MRNYFETLRIPEAIPVYFYQQSPLKKFFIKLIFYNIAVD